MGSFVTALRYRIEYFGFRLVGTLFWLMPVEMASALSGWAWRMIAPHLHRHQRALANLARAFPDMTHRQREKIARGMWDNLGRTFAESFHLKGLAASDRIHVEQPQLVADIARSGTGSVFCAAHLANWELLVAPMVHLGMQPAGIYQKVKNPLVDAWIRKSRAFLYTGGLLPKDRSSARALTRHAKSGGAVVLLADLRDFTGVRVTFFDQPAPTTPFPATLARLLDVPLVVATMVRLPGVRFAIRVERLDIGRSDDRDADILATTHAIQARLETAIRANPGQWMWGHRRWG